MLGETRRLANAATALVCATGVLIVVGASVRVNGAGLACPDWPLCFGELLPPMDVGVAFEFGHRVLAGSVSLGFLAIAVALLRRRAHLPAALPAVIGVAAALLCAQVVLGGLTVLRLLAEWTVASHLLVGNLFLATLAAMTMLVRDPSGRGPRAHLTPVARGGAVMPILLVPVQLVLGGLVAGAGAGLACPSFPSCAGGAWFPSFVGVLGWVVAHRLVAWLLLGTALMATVLVWSDPVARRPAVALTMALVAQAVVGVSNVLLRVPVELTLLHSAGAAVVVLAATWHGQTLLRAMPSTVDRSIAMRAA